MTRNSLLDLNNHLFEQMERLNDVDLTADELEMEMKRSKTMTEISEAIVNNASLMLKAEKMRVDYGVNTVVVPKIMDGRSK